MSVQLTEDVTWLAESYPHGEKHLHVSVYLVEHDDSYILVDSGSFYHREQIDAQLAETIGDAPVDALVLSHADLPHSGNVPEFRDRWPELTLVSSSGSPAVVGLGHADVTAEIGGTMDICGRTFSFVDPPLADIQHSTWIFDHDSGVLFTADGFGNYHAPEHAGEPFGAVDGGVPTADIRDYHRDALRWLCYVDPARIDPAVDALFEDLDVSVLAPTHGNPIEAADFPEYRARLWAAIEEISRTDPHDL
ncbi:MBL fold metallo-hydrolase [Salinirubellus salinus]|uniref:MBL fold metallo-hydrolase n=1 Tax=Salinirubellus salinus TaxID=1364945 RepID=A0A9E7UAV6_9EURY|nr:MBL fold metallo-hydrolase [Salinirubellus salinus]UWM54437.1 MBL fold metallo-hydrolase [Salinirubellus salinus]